MDPVGAGRSDGGTGLREIGYGNRRSRRYPLALDLRWKLGHGKRVLDSGTGTTVDLSSGGLLFETERAVRVGTSIQVSITWPVRLRNAVPLQLVVVGDVVRAAGRRVAIRIRHHEFRTVARKELAG